MDQCIILPACFSVPTTDSAFETRGNDTGITVPGSISTQRFVTASDFTTEVGDVLVIKLRGYVADKKVETPVTVEDKKTCPSCGKKSEFKAQFCQSCGTALVVV